MTRRSLWARLAPRSRAGLIGQLRSQVASLTALRERDGTALAQTAEALRVRVAAADLIRSAVASYGHPATGPIEYVVGEALAAVTTRMHRAEGELAAIRAELRDGWRPVPDVYNGTRAAVTEVLAELARDRGDDLHAELLAVDEALASAGATPADDRVAAIRALRRRVPTIGCECGATGWCARCDGSGVRDLEASDVPGADCAVRDAISVAPTIDGDVLRDAIVDAVPHTITDDDARALADQAPDGLVGAGMTVVHGPDGTPRPMREVDMDRLETMVEIDEARADGDDVPTEVRPRVSAPEAATEATEICNVESSHALTPPVRCDRGKGHDGWHYHHATTYRWARAEDVPWERTVSIGWATPGEWSGS